MKSVNLQIGFDELSQFIDNQGDYDNYQHVQRVMNSLGKHPIIPAFQTISKIGTTVISERLRTARYFSVEGKFSSIICPEETIVFRRTEANGRMAFLWENPERYLKRFNLKSFVETTFRINDRYESPVASRPYSRRLRMAQDKLESFSRIIGACKQDHLTDMFYVATCATSIIVQGFKDPRNEFEDKIASLRNKNESTPFYRHIKLSFNNSNGIAPRDVLYEFGGQMRPPRTVFINFRATSRTGELLNGILRLDFIAKASVLRFTKDLPN